MEFSVPMALVDFIPVALFLAGAILLQQDLYPQFEAKMKEAQKEADPEKYTKLMGEAEQLMMDTYVHSVLYFGNRIYTLRTDRFEGVEQNRSGADLNFIFAKAIA